MVEEVYKNIYRIEVPLPGNPLKELNSYFIRGTDSDLLIDTGFRREACRTALEEGLAFLGSDPARRDVLVTHLHSDHSGLADLFVGRGRTIWMSAEDLFLFRKFHEDTKPEFQYQRFPQEGFSAEMLREVYATNPAMTERMPRVDERLRPVRDGDRITIDIPGGQLHLDVSEEELAARRAALVPHDNGCHRGWLSRYSRLVGSATGGAVLEEN